MPTIPPRGEEVGENSPMPSLNPVKRFQARAGAVVTEFAICAPLLFFFFFASLEFSRVNMIRQSVENAVYEGARRGIVPGATAANCQASAQAVLNSISATGANCRWWFKTSTTSRKP